MRSPSLALLAAAAAAAALVAVPTPAHAMGAYVTFDLLGWNADGTAAIIARDSSSSGTVGVTHELFLVGTRDAAPLVFTFDDTQDPDTRGQKIDVATCRATARALAKALASHRFTGAKVRPARCTSDRAVLALPPPVRSATIGDLGQRPPVDVREVKVEELLVRALGALPADADVESLTGELVIVLSGVNGDDTSPAHAAVIAATPAGPKSLVADLRER